MNWKKYLAVSISVVAMVATEQVLQACADYNAYDTYPKFFGNTITDKPAYLPFSFVESDLYYEEYDYSTEESSLSVADKVNKNLILDEWKIAFDNKFSKEELEAVIYSAKLNDFFVLLGENNENKNEELAKNNFFKFLSEKKNKSYLDYLIFAKKCEVNANQYLEDWNSNKTKPLQTNASLKDEALRLLKNEKNNFIKMKYAFQIIRLSFNDEDYDEVLNLFDTLLKGKEEKSVAYTRILGYKAGAYYRKGEKATAGYYYSKMFDNTDANKFEAMVSFEWSRLQYNQENSSLVKDRLQEILDLCKNDHERAVVMVMKGLRAYPNFALEDIKKAYAFDPKVRGIDVLVNREINKIENTYFRKQVYAQNALPDASRWYYQIRSFDYAQSESDAKIDMEYVQNIKDLNAFTDVLIADKKSGSPAMWFLTKAYLACMQNQVSIMQQNLDQAKAAGMNKNEQSVYQVIDILYTLYKSKTITPQIESEMLPKLQALNNKAKTSNLGSNQFRDIMNNLVAGKYFQQGDTIKGVYAMGHANSWEKNRTTFYADTDFQDMQGEVLNNMSIAKLQETQTFRTRTNKSPFENWLVDNTYYTYEVLKELEGTQYIRNGDYKSAIKIFEQKDIAVMKFNNPFMPQINDYIETTSQDTLRTYSKLSFSKRMAELQDIIAKNPKDAGAIYGYAVALYNISYYGKSANIVAYNRFPTDDNGYFKDDSDSKMPRHLLEYYRVFSAEQYFNKAAAASPDPELKAKALWGAAKCWTKRCPPVKEYRYYDKSYYLNALTNPYFEKLSSTFANTKFMNTVSGTCEYYADYLRSK